MNTKNVVKVMKFHALLRVDKAKKRAQKYIAMEGELRRLIDIITNNRNLLLDKNLLKPPVNGPELIIYFGSDYGFCGNYNSKNSEQIRKDTTSQKILIGKRIFTRREDILFHVSREEIEKGSQQVTEAIREGIKKNKYSRIKVVYNEYINTSEIKWVTTEVYPLKLKKEKGNEGNYIEDFVCETDIDELLIGLLSTYVNYELKLVAMNTYASENIMRQNATQDSIKRIEEREEEAFKEERKRVNTENFQKVIENYSKFRYR